MATPSPASRISRFREVLLAEGPGMSGQIEKVAVLPRLAGAQAPYSAGTEPALTRLRADRACRLCLTRHGLNSGAPPCARPRRRWR